MSAYAYPQGRFVSSGHSTRLAGRRRGADGAAAVGLLSVGLTILSGAAGMMFLGFAGFFGVGAYAAALMCST
jgi:ABC-type branched-subunit amino acid transport system permease subunit